jgi:hypothetical protein
MTRFLLVAFLINAAALAGLALGRHRLARLPMPGLWWLGVLGIAIVLTLQAAGGLLP